MAIYLTSGPLWAAMTYTSVFQRESGTDSRQEKSFSGTGKNGTTPGVFQRETGTVSRQEKSLSGIGKKGYGGTPWQTVDQALARWQEAQPFAAALQVQQAAHPCRIAEPEPAQQQTAQQAHSNPPASIVA